MGMLWPWSGVNFGANCGRGFWETRLPWVACARLRSPHCAVDMGAGDAICNGATGRSPGPPVGDPDRENRLLHNITSTTVFAWPLDTAANVNFIFDIFFAHSKGDTDVICLLKRQFMRQHLKSNLATRTCCTQAHSEKNDFVHNSVDHEPNEVIPSENVTLEIAKAKNKSVEEKKAARKVLRKLKYKRKCRLATMKSDAQTFLDCKSFEESKVKPLARFGS